MSSTIDFLIPAYQRASVFEAVKSIHDQVEKNQTWDRHSIIVADDASSVGDVDERLRNLISEFPNIDLIRRPNNVGMSKNLYQLALESDGDFIFVLTDDDQLLPNALFHLDDFVKQAETFKAGCVVSPRQVHLETGEMITLEPAMLGGSRYFRPSPINSMRTAHMAHVLSGLLLQRSAINFELWERAHDNAYFPILVVGDIVRAKGVCYRKAPVVRHTVENKVFWNRWGQSSSDVDLRLYQDYHRALDRLIGAASLTQPVHKILMFLATGKQLIRFEGSRALNKRCTADRLPSEPLHLAFTRRFISLAVCSGGRPLRLMQRFISRSKVRRHLS